MTKVAVAVENNAISMHFGHCREYKVLEIENGIVHKQELLPSPGHAPGRIPAWLNEHGVHTVIAGGMGMKARELFRGYGIDCVLGIDGPVEAVIEKVLNGTLVGGDSACTHGPDHKCDGDC